MNRRGFLRSLAGAPVAAAAGAVAAGRPAYAEGGVVKATPVLVGERAPETIVTVDCHSTLTQDQVRRLVRRSIAEHETRHSGRDFRA